MQHIDLRGKPKEKLQNHTSKGNQPKWKVGAWWYKADHMGYEALAEYVVSELLKKSNVPEFVAYDIVKIQYDETESIGCVSENFKQKHETLIPLEKLHRQYFGKGLAEVLAKKETAQEKITYTVDFVKSVTDLSNVGRYFSVMAAIDAFFLNEDRHTNNIAVIRNENTKSFRLAPMFDHGLSLLSDLNDYPTDRDVYENIGKVQAKPFHIHFDEQLDAMEELYGSHLQFTFNREDIYNLLDGLAGIYDHAILWRVEKVLLEQMRKYAIYF